MLSELAQFGLGFDPAIFREIWEWRFPTLLAHEGLTVRKALEGWPLLSETPMVGGSTSRFVDSSIERFELAAQSSFNQRYALFVNGRELPFRSISLQGIYSGTSLSEVSVVSLPASTNHNPITFINYIG